MKTVNVPFDLLEELRDSAYAEAQAYHQSMAGYREHEHARLDEIVRRTDALLATAQPAADKQEDCLIDALTYGVSFQLDGVRIDPAIVLIIPDKPAADGEREAFETWAWRTAWPVDGMEGTTKDEFFKRDFLHPEKYRKNSLNDDWRAWQARAALPAKAEGVAVPDGFALALETAVEMPDGSKELGYTVLARVGVFDSSDEVIDAIKQLELPIGWVSIRVDQLLPGRIAAAPVPPVIQATFTIGDPVRKTKGSRWQGRIVGTYSTALTPEGYAVESDTETGSVQIYPVSALERVRGDQDE